jgi:hypothetical protein
MNLPALLRSLTRRLPLVALVCSCFACSESVSSQGSGPGAKDANEVRSIEIKHEPCDVESKESGRVDINNDGRSEVTHVNKGGHEACRAVDLNFDGRIDSYVYFDKNGQMRRRESDFDRDGALDEIAIFEGGRLVRKERETNLDQKIDTWDFYQNDVLVRRERDSNNDGRVDQWWSFPDPSHLECPVVETDSDGDGKPDTRMDVCKEREAANAAASAAMPQTQAAPPASSVLAPAPSAVTPADAGAPKDAGGAK